MTFVIYPAIDLIDGKCVRLYQGDYSKETVYEDDPVSQALRFEAEGAQWLHVVDLDAARTGSLKNTEIIREICKQLEIPIQVGGGIREYDTARHLYDIGVERTVIGTAAVEDPELVSKVANDGYRVAVGVDGKNGFVATRGWKVATDIKVVDTLHQLEESGAETAIVTDIQRDGTMGGSDLSGLKNILSKVKIPLIASGGLGSLKHLSDLLQLRSQNPQLAGIITGKALYEDKLNLKDLISMTNESTVEEIFND